MRGCGSRLGEAFVTISANLDGLDTGLNTARQNTARAVTGIEKDFTTMNSSLQTGIKEAVYGINAGTASIVNSYVNMHVAARREVSQLTNETIRCEDNERADPPA